MISYDFINFLNSPYISIPLHTILDEFYTNPKIKTNLKKSITSLTDQEYAVVELLRKDGIKEIRIRLNKKNKGQILIEIVELKELEMMKDKVKKLLGNERFKSIKINIENGSLVLYEEITKIKL